ncbi:MAG: hypothetical protein KG012_03355 [Deltaproteobacteria bacterium]|nr:hypothetical protein [Deltaproteobacteria bacterium]
MDQNKIKETLLAKGLTEEEVSEIISFLSTPPESKPEIKKELIQAGLTKEEAESIAKKIVDEAVGKAYLKCPGCGNLIKKEDPSCYKCNLTYNKDSQKWEDKPKPSRKGKEITIAGFKIDEVDND